MFYYDWTMLILIPALLLSMYAQAKVQSNFNKYSKVNTASGITGAQAAQRILSQAGINDVTIEGINTSDLGDHFDPKAKVIRLSNNVYGSNSVAAIGIAAHECGHAIQEARGYVPNKIRRLSVPLASIGSYAAFPLFLIGLILSLKPLWTAGIILFSLTTLFYLITLPVEFDASHRAMKILGADTSYMTAEELKGARNVLSAAAMTYLAAALMSLLQLFRLILISRRR